MNSAKTLPISFSQAAYCAVGTPQGAVNTDNTIIQKPAQIPLLLQITDIMVNAILFVMANNHFPNAAKYKKPPSTYISPHTQVNDDLLVDLTRSVYLPELLL